MRNALLIHLYKFLTKGISSQSAMFSLSIYHALKTF